MSRLADLTGLDTVGIPVYSAIRPFGRSLSSAQGKGVTTDLAMLSALGETVEVWRMEHLADPECMDTTHIINLFTEKSQFKSQAYLSEISLDLRGLHSAIDKPRKNSNGVGSSWDKYEAMSHAIYELIERKSIDFWRAIPAQQRIHHLVSQTLLKEINPELSNLPCKLAASNVDLALWDITMPGSFSCFHAVIGNQYSEFFPQLAEGSACHPNPFIAIQKAVLEAIQSRLTIISGSRDDLPLSFYSQYISTASDRMTVPQGTHRPSLTISNEKPISQIRKICIDQNYSLDLMNCLILSHGSTDYLSIKLDHPNFLTPSRKLL
tara:strand:+ start:4232 stop:5197 length:966 start_codon:yes stop_codon:yes gene_type:complete